MTEMYKVSKVIEHLGTKETFAYFEDGIDAVLWVGVIKEVGSVEGINYEVDEVEVEINDC